MNKCEIIRDLLPIYIDDCCSESSRIFVEEHLCECEECKRIYKELNTDISIKNDYTVPAESEEFYFQKGKEIIADEIKKDYVQKIAIIDIILNLVLLIASIVFIKESMNTIFPFPILLVFIAVCFLYDVTYIIQYKRNAIENLVRAVVMSQFFLKAFIIFLSVMFFPIMYFF